ncbi:DarT ssDNA thymidine ADP-ribosyltransferase family protein [Salinibacterium sp. ZJ70]|uniref:DarT ssDNA thymidine ADP-ribosyltransferase family protein n=1 Tax=Salinibacterium sp. ZJ70 TaxID=2708084 RepID=UPI00141E20B4|nr:DarT ssDNA thymidine ADP-ribosyltransferase family protein [Salinibacterium sp. ZJ70]
MRTAPASTSSTSTSRSAVSGAPSSLRLSGRRVFRPTHLRTLGASLEVGALLAGAVPAIDVLSPTARELRSTATVPDGRALSEFVAFSIAQDSTRWQELRSGARGAHWSPAARALRAIDFVILAVPVDALGEDVVFADRDAAAVDTRFASGLEDGTNALRRLHASDPEFRDAELLVPGLVELSDIAIITVANERVRDQVRELFAAGEMRPPRIAVYPPAFQPVDELV